MNYSQFLNMLPEVCLTAILIITFLVDAITAQKPVLVEGEECAVHQNPRAWFNPLVVIMLAITLVINICPAENMELFGGMYHTSPAIGAIKTVLLLGTIIVLIQGREWLSRKDTSYKEGEAYMLVVSTLLGMDMMVSANHFLLFFLGLEMASVPMACLVALDKYRHNSAEAGAKFILTATFSSGVMLYGISLLYGLTGTMYFDDFKVQLAAQPSVSWLSVAGLVFFFSGLAFKLSLVPFHFWTADTYQGAPTTITGYLSVCSKGAAAFTLCYILIEVFAPMVAYWQVMLSVVIVLSITVANLFAIHQKDLKRFMAFSSISQAGYIVLAILGNNGTAATGYESFTALSFYILVYVVANMAVFAVIGSIEEHNGGKVGINDYNGLYRTNPKLAFLMTLALFSLGGIPPFAGMFSKFFVFMAALNGASLTDALGITAYVVVFIALVNTVISLYYYLLIVKAMFIRPNENPLPTFTSSNSTKFALALCITGVLLFGVVSGVYEWLAVAV